MWLLLMASRHIAPQMQAPSFSYGVVDSSTLPSLTTLADTLAQHPKTSGQPLTLLLGRNGDCGDERQLRADVL
jgi:hypothetical protein